MSSVTTNSLWLPSVSFSVGFDQSRYSLYWKAFSPLFGYSFSLCAPFRVDVYIFGFFCRLTSYIFTDSTWANRTPFTIANRVVFVTLVCLLDSHLIEMSLYSVKSVDTLYYLHVMDSPVLQCNTVQVWHCPALQKQRWFYLSLTINSFSLCENDAYNDAHQQFTFFYSLIVTSFTVHIFTALFV